MLNNIMLTHRVPECCLKLQTHIVLINRLPAHKVLNIILLFQRMQTHKLLNPRLDSSMQTHRVLNDEQNMLTHIVPECCLTEC